jgi:hypothetical protein
MLRIVSVATLTDENGGAFRCELRESECPVYRWYAIAPDTQEAFWDGWEYPSVPEAEQTLALDVFTAAPNVRIISIDFPDR